MSFFNLDKVRVDTPGVKDIIHFNNAGAALPPNKVLEVMMHYLQKECLIGSYEAEELNNQTLENLYKLISQVINSNPDEVALFENSTLAWNTVFWSIPLSPDQIILTSENEYGSNYLALLQREKRDNVKFIVIPQNDNGEIDVELIRYYVKFYNIGLISISHISNNSGVIQPIDKIGTIAREYYIPYIVDACQSTGHIKVDVKQIQCDFLTTAGRKYLRGPRGTAFAYINRKWLDSLTPRYSELNFAKFTNSNNYIYTHKARRFEFGEANVAARIGFAAALDYMLEIGIKNISERIHILATYLRAKLKNIPSVYLCDSDLSFSCGIVSFTISNVEPFLVRQWLFKNKINISIVDRKWAYCYMKKRQLTYVFRISLHYYNTEVEIDYFCQILKQYIDS